MAGRHAATLCDKLGNWEAIELYQRYRSGVTKRELRNCYRMSGSTVNETLLRVEREARKRGLTDGQMNRFGFGHLLTDAVRAKVARGEDPDELAETLGVPRCVVRGWCGMRSAAKSMPRASRHTLAKIGHLWREGLTGPQIGYELGLSEMAVYEYARTHRDECPRRRG